MSRGEHTVSGASMYYLKMRFWVPTCFGIFGTHLPTETLEYSPCITGTITIMTNVLLFIICW